MESRFIDLHIHPAMKPLGKSFNRTVGKNHPNKNRTSSIWHYDPPTLFDKIANILLTLTKFRQSDFTTLAKGNASIVCASLCGLEKGFLMTKAEIHIHPKNLRRSLRMKNWILRQVKNLPIVIQVIFC